MLSEVAKYNVTSKSEMREQQYTGSKFSDFSVSPHLSDICLQHLWNCFVEMEKY